MKDRESITTNGRATFYAAIWNDLMHAAMYKGWALALHGSLNSDMDIMAMPWTDDAKSVDEMISALENCLTQPTLGILWSPTIISYDKPNNRVVYTIHIFGDFYLDVNIIQI